MRALRATIGMIDLDAVAGGDELCGDQPLGGPTWLRDDALAAAKGLGVAAGHAARRRRPAGRHHTERQR